MRNEDYSLLRHIPDLSNVSSGFGSEGEPSFSFQIPSRTQLDNEDLLLHDNGGDFFRGANGEEYSLLNATPAPSQHHQQQQQTTATAPVSLEALKLNIASTYTSTSASVLVDSPKKNLLLQEKPKRNLLPTDDDDFNDAYSTPKRLAKLKSDLEIFSETEWTPTRSGSMEAENLVSGFIPSQPISVTTSTCEEQRAVETKNMTSDIDLRPVQRTVTSANVEAEPSVGSCDDESGGESQSNEMKKPSTVVGKQMKQKEQSGKKPNSTMKQGQPEPEIRLPPPSSVPKSTRSRSSKYPPTSEHLKPSVSPVPRASNPPTYNTSSPPLTSRTSPSKSTISRHHVSFSTVNDTVCVTSLSPVTPKTPHNQTNEAHSTSRPNTDLASHSSSDPPSSLPDAIHESASDPATTNSSPLETLAPVTQDVGEAQTVEEPPRTSELSLLKETIHEHPTGHTDAPVDGLGKPKPDSFVEKRGGEGKRVVMRGGKAELVKNKEKEKRVEEKELTAKKSRLQVQSAIPTAVKGAGAVDVRRKQVLLDDLGNEDRDKKKQPSGTSAPYATTVITDLSATPSQMQNNPDPHLIATSTVHHTSTTDTTLTPTSKGCTDDTAPGSSSPQHDATHTHTHSNHDRQPERADHAELSTISQLSPVKAKPAPSETQSASTCFSAPDNMDTRSPDAQVIPAAGSRVSLGKRVSPSSAAGEVEGERKEGEERCEETERPPKKRQRLPSAGGHALRPPPQLPSVGTRTRMRDEERQGEQPKQPQPTAKNPRGHAPTANATITYKRASAVDVGKKQKSTDSLLVKDDGDRKRKVKPSSSKQPLSLNSSETRKPISSASISTVNTVPIVQDTNLQTQSNPEPVVGPTTTSGAISMPMECTSHFSSESSQSHRHNEEVYPHLDLAGGCERDRDDPDKPLTVSQLSPRKLAPTESPSTSSELHMALSTLDEGGTEDTDTPANDHHDEGPGATTAATNSSSRSSLGKRASVDTAAGKRDEEGDGGSERPRKKARVPSAAPRASQPPSRTRGAVMRRVVSDSAPVPISERVRARRMEKEQAMKEIGKEKGVAGSGPVVSGSGSVSTRRKAITNTKPFEFNFRTDSRAAEKAERQRQQHHQRSTTTSSSASTSTSVSAFTNATASTSTRTSTKPFEFNFKTDLRAAERAERQQQRATSTSSSTSVNGKLPSTFTSSVHKIPDFKVSHAQLDSAFAARKSQLTPVVPISMEMHTEVRAQQRAEFELVLKEKERKREEMEELRRQEEREEEEREVREIRRRIDEVNKARARPVPEWYYDRDKGNGSADTEEVEKEGSLK
ncbi:hypothetical protein L218DRAFT_1079946 [Marasmius fiardii PR-910]|nr:hypothetical protein L218DRAFT_1079946 [Marasmius fiardii PR-910]